MRPVTGTAKQQMASNRRRAYGLMIPLAFILIVSWALRAADDPAIKPFALEVEPPQVIQTGAMFPYLWLLRDGSALLEVSKGNRLLRRPGFEYQQQDPLFLVSRDGLKTWQPWAEAGSVAELPWFEGSALQLRDGSVLMFEYIAYKVASGKYEGRMWKSDAGWRTFEGPSTFTLSVPNYEEGGQSDQGKPFLAVPWHRSVIEMPDGSLLAAIYGRFQGDRTPSEYEPLMFRMRAFTVVSRDQGKTWTYLATIASAPVEQEGFDEPSMIRLSQGEHKGRLICLMRTGRLNAIYQSESDDDGKSWTPAHPLSWMYSKFGHWRAIVGTDPDLIEMHDGTLAVSFGDKPDFEDDGDFVAFSPNQGISWTQVTRLSMERTCAYTSLAEVEPGVLYVTYSGGGLGANPLPAHTDRTSHFRVLGQRVHVRRQ